MQYLCRICCKQTGQCLLPQPPPYSPRVFEGPPPQMLQSKPSPPHPWPPQRMNQIQSDQRLTMSLGRLQFWGSGVFLPLSFPLFQLLGSSAAYLTWGTASKLLDLLTRTPSHPFQVSIRRMTLMTGTWISLTWMRMSLRLCLSLMLGSLLQSLPQPPTLTGPVRILYLQQRECDPQPVPVARRLLVPIWEASTFLPTPLNLSGEPWVLEALSLPPVHLQVHSEAREFSLRLHVVQSSQGQRAASRPPPSRALWRLGWGDRSLLVRRAVPCGSPWVTSGEVYSRRFPLARLHTPPHLAPSTHLSWPIILSSWCLPPIKRLRGQERTEPGPKPGASLDRLDYCPSRWVWEAC